MTDLADYTHTPRAQFAAEAIRIGDVDDRERTNMNLVWGRQNASKTWKWYDKIGEVRYGIARSARIAGYAELHIQVRNDEGEWERVPYSDPISREADRIYCPSGGTRGLIERFYTLVKIPGDCYLIEDPKGNGYHFLSSDELDVGDTADISVGRQDGVRWRTAPETGATKAFYQDIPGDNLIGRVWAPSKRYYSQVDSPMLALELECEILNMLTELMKSRLKSRFALNGIFYIPDTINEVNVATADGEPKREKVLSYLARAMTLNVQHFDKPEASVPIFLRGPGEAGDQIRLIRQDESLSETDIKLRGELIDRILDGLDVQKKTTGGGSDSTNHWERWSITDEERRITVQPDLEMMCWALTQLVLGPRLERRRSGVKKLDIPNYRIWFDLSAASIRANQSEDARQLHDRNAIGEAALRRIHNLRDSDAPTSEERIRNVGWKMGLPRLALYQVDGADDIPDEWLVAQKPGPNPDSPADDSTVGEGRGQPGSPDDQDSDTPQRERPA